MNQCNVAMHVHVATQSMQHLVCPQPTSMCAAAMFNGALNMAGQWEVGWAANRGVHVVASRVEWLDPPSPACSNAAVPSGDYPSAMSLCLQELEEVP